VAVCVCVCVYVFRQVMAALEGHGTAAPTLAAGRQRPPPNPAERLLEQCGGGGWEGGAVGRGAGHSVKISGLHEDADNGALFALLHSIGLPASDVDVPFDPDTGVCARAHQPRMHAARGGTYPLRVCVRSGCASELSFRLTLELGAPVTGESFGYGVATFPDRVAALRVIEALNAASPSVVTAHGGCLQVQMMP